MYAVAQNLFSSLLGRDISGKAGAKKRVVKATITRRHQERVELIDKMCATWGTDINLVKRYFQLSQAA